MRAGGAAPVAQLRASMFELLLGWLISRVLSRTKVGWAAKTRQKFHMMGLVRGMYEGKAKTYPAQALLLSPLLLLLALPLKSFTGGGGPPPLTMGGAPLAACC